MRCNNCLWFPMEESDGGLICPNCGYEEMESPEQNFVRIIYQNYMMPKEGSEDSKMETLEYWDRSK